MTYIDDYVMADANYRDLCMGLGILVEKRQLLKGEPTQIISVDERKTLNQLLPPLIVEAQRRNVAIPGAVVEKTIETVLELSKPEGVVV